MNTTKIEHENTQQIALSSICMGMNMEEAVQKALNSAFAPAGYLEMLKKKPFLSSKEVFELYGIPESSLRTWKCRGGGPKFCQAYRNAPVRYEHEEIKKFMYNTKMQG